MEPVKTTRSTTEYQMTRNLLRDIGWETIPDAPAIASLSAGSDYIDVTLTPYHLGNTLLLKYYTANSHEVAVYRQPAPDQRSAYQGCRRRPPTAARLPPPPPWARATRLLLLRQPQRRLYRPGRSRLPTLIPTPMRPPSDYQ